MRYDGKPFDASSIGSASNALGYPRHHGRPARRDGRNGRRPTAVQQGGPVELPAGAGGDDELGSVRPELQGKENSTIAVALLMRAPNYYLAVEN